ncbi:MAG: MoaD family protein [Thaumarchaeota archaeon]|nr:MoaD family protein [Nitrososphaerota archaeon]
MQASSESYVLVKYFAKVREITKKREEKIPIRNTMAVDEFLSELFSKYGHQLEEFVMKNDGTLKKNIGILVNGSPLKRNKIRDSYLSNLDEFVILPPISGG